MKLSAADAALFYRLMWSLQFYANQQLQVVPGVVTVTQYARLPLEQKIPVRNALFDNPRLLAAYVAANPAGLDADSQAIVAGWQHFLRGRFVIERFLRQGAIFVGLQHRQDRVYVVQGLQASVAELLDSPPLPLAVETILLPFRHGIVIDGIVGPLPITLGRHLAAELAEVYEAARQHNRLISTLLPSPAAAPPDLPDWAPQVAALQDQARRLRGSRQAPLQSAAFAVVRASVAVAAAAVNRSDAPGAVRDELIRLRRALARLETKLLRAERE